MKKVLFLCLLIAHVSYGQIFTQSSSDGSIIITPKGLQGKTNPSADSTNVVFGPSALLSVTRGDQNTAIGAFALQKSRGNGSTANGYNSLRANSEGGFNTAVGAWALNNNTTGTGLAAYGFSAGSNDIYGGFNTYIGAFTNLVGSGYATNSTALGNGATINASNKVRIGNDQVTVIEGQVAWSNPSDRRIKENIFYTNRLGLDFINRLQTVSYNYTIDKAKTRYDGFIAQDIEAIMKELNVPFSGLKKSDDGTYSLAYSDFVMPLVNAVKELKQKNEELEARLSALEVLKAEITKLKADNALRNADKK